MYLRCAQRSGWKAELVETQAAEHGYRTATLRLKGAGVDALQAESGIHKVQHKTRSRNKDRIHTSVVTVVALRPSLDATTPLRRQDVRRDTFRGSGKGGQHRNVTDSGVRLTHLPTGFVATVTRGRKQGTNESLAWEVLSARVGAAEQAEHDRHRNRKRATHTARADRAGAGRVYDRVRDMIRTAEGRKIHGVERVLDGDLSRVL